MSVRFKVSKKTTEYILWNIVYFILPIVLFYLMEGYEHYAWAEKQVRPTAQLFNIIIFELIAWCIYFIVGRLRIAAGIITLLSMVFGLVNHYVVQFRGSPFVPWDIYSIRTAASVASNYDFKPEARVVIVSLIFIFIFIAIMFVKVKMKMKIYFRLIPAIIAMIVLFVFINRLWDDDFQNKNFLYPFLFTPGYMTQVNGMAVTFAMDLEYAKVDKPTSYDAEEVRNLLEKYKQKENMDENSMMSGIMDYPNIIVVMDEAFSDLSVLNKFICNEDYMPYVHSLQNGAENTVTGYLDVSVCGGNTANSEYEFLTGNTMAFLPNGSIPYQQYIRNDVPTLVHHLKDLGYATYAQHPFYASGWNRDKVYKWFGFDELSFVYDYPSRKIVRKYVSDKSSFEHIIRTFENKEDGKPAFIFNVTMQNHGGYTDSYDNFENTIQATEFNSDSLNQYLSLIRITDGELENLIQYFSTVDENTVIVFFGDHQPSNAVTYQISDAGIDDASRYKVPFVLWANYDIDEATDVETSLNYFGAKVLQIAGVPTNDYENYLLDLEKEYRIISAMKTDKSDNASEESLSLYKKVQYYMMFDAEVN